MLTFPVTQNVDEPEDPYLSNLERNGSGCEFPYATYYLFGTRY